MHIADIDLGIIGANGIVGGGIPIAMGAGIALVNQNKKNVIVCFFGDGASNIGGFHESLNMASIWGLPVIFFCENNLYGISGHAKDTLNIRDISERAKSYGIPGVTVDGNNIFEVYAATKEARERAVAGKGPTLLESKTYRWLGHWHADPCRYRTDDEVEEWKKKCPIKFFKKHFVDEGIFTEDQLNEMEEKIKTEIEETEQYTLSSPEPDPEEALEDIYPA